VLLELAAINTAISTIKQTIAHGRDLASASSAISKFVGAEEELRERANAKKNSIFTKLLGKDTNDFEEFMALEEIETKKQELREMLQLYGRIGMYNDWIKFQKDARLKRQKDKEERDEQIQKIIRYSMIGLLVLVILGGALLIGYVSWYLKGI
tara:strand:- start:644 stop:1102 length:459 start_codon:yes stop_codon:yes gene_type:complete